MTTQPGIYEGPLPPSFAFGRCVLDVAYASFDSPDDADNLPEKRRPVRAALELTPNLTGAFGAARTLYGPVGVTLTTENGVFDFWAIDSTNSTVTPAGWSWKAALKVDGVAWSRFEFTPDSTSTDPLNLLDAALLASAATPPAQVSLAEQITRTWDGQINGYQTRTVSGAATIDSGTGTWALDLAGDTTLTIDGKNGSTVALNAAPNGHTLTVTDGPTLTTGGLTLLKRTRDLWVPATSTAASSGGEPIKVGGVAPASGWWLDTEAAPTVTTVTATAPTFTDADGTAADTYTIPATAGVEYLVGGTPQAAGTYPGTGTVTVTARATTGYALTGTASWSNTYSTTTAPVSVTATAPTMDDTADTYTIPSKAGVDYYVGGVKQTAGTKTYSDTDTDVTVTAQAQAGYTLTGTASWTLDFTKKAVAPVPSGAYDDAVLADSPILYVPLDDAVGTTSPRVLGTLAAQNPVGAPVGATLGAPGIGDGSTSASFPGGVSSYVETSGTKVVKVDGTSGAFWGITAVGIEVLCDLTSTAAAPSGVAIVVGAGNSIALGMRPDGRIVASCGGSTSFVEAASTAPFTDRQHLAMDWDGTTVRIYRNGSVIGSVAKAGTIQVDARFVVGNTGPTRSGDSPAGLIAGAAVYTAAPGAARFLAHAQAAGLA